jgi:uncharacterized coiled-coil protein SlyX
VLIFSNKDGVMTVAYGADPNREQRSTAEEAGPAGGNVTITITGQTAADMIGRGDDYARAKQHLNELAERLARIEALAGEKADEHTRLSRVAADLHDKLAQSNAEALQLRDELRRLREEMGDHNYKFTVLQEKVRSLTAALAPQSGLAPHEAMEPGSPEQGGLNGHAGVSLDATTAPAGGEAGSSRRSGTLGAILRGRFNFGAAIWAAGAVATLAAAAGAALWLYT